MNNIVGRIHEIAENESITLFSLEKKIGATKNVLSRAVKNNTDIQSKWITLLVNKYPQYSTRWLITGKGNMLKEEVGSTKKFEELKDENMQLLKDNIALIKELRALEHKFNERGDTNGHRAVG